MNDTQIDTPLETQINAPDFECLDVEQVSPGEQEKALAEGNRPLALLVYLLMGSYLGFIFVQSEVVSWFRIQEMFRFQSFHMYGIIGSAVAVAALSLFLIRKLQARTLHGEHIELSDKGLGRWPPSRRPILARWILLRVSDGHCWAPAPGHLRPHRRRHHRARYRASRSCRRTGQRHGRHMDVCRLGTVFLTECATRRPRSPVNRFHPPQSTAAMLIRQIFDPKLAQYAYLVGCQQTKEALIIDPERDVDQYVSLAASEGLTIVAVAETHIHADFLSGARELAERHGAKLFLSDEGAADGWASNWAKEGAYDVTFLRDGDSFRDRQYRDPGDPYARPHARAPVVSRSRSRRWSERAHGPRHGRFRVRRRSRPSRSPRERGEGRERDAPIGAEALRQRDPIPRLRRLSAGLARPRRRIRLRKGPRSRPPDDGRL
jgi:hypothetical protein